MKIIEDLVQEVLEEFNKTLTAESYPYQVELSVKCRLKQFYLNRNDSYEQRIAEMSLFQKGDPTLLLWRKELLMPAKVSGTPQHLVDEDYKRALFKYFFFEAVGNFCNMTHSLIVSQDYAEYDIEKDRLKPHPSGDGMVIKTTGQSPLYAPGCEFDVFMVTDTGYAVYTAHDLAKPNNGIGIIPKDHAMVLTPAKIKILTLDQL